MEPVEPSLETEGETAERYHELLALSRVSAALSGLWDLDAILRIALDNVLSIMNGTVGGILLVDEQTQTLSYRVHRGLDARDIEKVRLGLGEGTAGRVAQSGKAILLEDISVDPGATYLDLVNSQGLKGFLSVPLRSKDKVLGVINIASPVPRRFSRSDRYILYSIGDQLGVAIEEAKLYERLRKARERYRKLVRQTIVAEEQERKRIARELHDEASQTLSGLTLQLQALADMAGMSDIRDAEFISKLKKVQSLAIQVHHEIARLMADLRPALLDTLGLVPAIRQYAESNLHPLGINIVMETKGMDRRLPEEVETELFRVAQGVLSNIAQHSQAKNATIILELLDSECRLYISDDGVGFDVSKVTNIEESGRGRGLFSMRERIALLGGTGSIESQPGHGTAYSATVPISWD